MSTSISLRLSDRCQECIQLLPISLSKKRQIRLHNQNTNQKHSYEFDTIYGKQITNYQIYKKLRLINFYQYDENDIGMSNIHPHDNNDIMNNNNLINNNNININQLDSRLLFFMGNQQSGKTYSILGQQQNFIKSPGILTYFIRDIFQYSFVHPNHPITYINQSNFKIQLKILQSFQDIIQNLGYQIYYGQSSNQKDMMNKFDYKIELKNYQHYCSCIEKVYQKKKGYSHLIIEIFIKSGENNSNNHVNNISNSNSNNNGNTQQQNHNKKKINITFVELSSACYDQHSHYYIQTKKDIQALISIFQNIPRIKYLEHIFQGSKLTRSLKNNFYQAKKINFIGLLDQDFISNRMTLKWMQMAQQQKQDEIIIQTIRQDIKRQQDYLKSLIDKHKKALNLLSKCIGVQLSLFDKQKNASSFAAKRQFQVGLGNTLNNNFNKRCQKIKIANNRKQENQNTIQQYNKLISLQRQQISRLQYIHQQNLKRLCNQKSQILQQRNRIFLRLQQYNKNLQIKNSFMNSKNNKNSNINGNIDSCIYWTPQFNYTSEIIDPLKNMNQIMLNTNRGSLINYNNTGNNKEKVTVTNREENLMNTNNNGNKTKQSNNSSKNSKNNKNQHNINSQTKQNLQTQNNLTNSNQPNNSTKKLIKKRLDLSKFPLQIQQKQNLLLQYQREHNIRQKQINRQIYMLFLVITRQEEYLQGLFKKGSYVNINNNNNVNNNSNRNSNSNSNNNNNSIHTKNNMDLLKLNDSNIIFKLSNKLINKIKNRQNQIINNNAIKNTINQQKNVLLFQCLKQGKYAKLTEYQNYMKNQQTLIRFNKELQYRNRKTQSMMKSQLFN